MSSIVSKSCESCGMHTSKLVSGCVDIVQRQLDCISDRVAKLENICPSVDSVEPAQIEDAFCADTVANHDESILTTQPEPALQRDIEVRSDEGDAVAKDDDSISTTQPEHALQRDIEVRIRNDEEALLPSNGDTVYVDGLIQAPQYNGQFAVVLGYDAPTEPLMLKFCPDRPAVKIRRGSV